MSQLIDGDGVLYGTVVINKKNGTKITLDTDKKYVNKDIELTINAQEATPSFDGGELDNLSSTITYSNMEVSRSNSSGVFISSRATAGRKAVLYNGDVNGWVNANDNENVIPAINSTEITGLNYYVTGITLGSEKEFHITVPYGQNTMTYYFSVDQNNVAHITADPPITDHTPFDEMAYYGRCGEIVCGNNTYGKTSVDVL